MRKQLATYQRLLFAPIVAISAVVGCGIKPEPVVSDAASVAEPADNAPESPVVEEEIDREGQLLRHTVFFSFKEESSPEDIQDVVDEFAGLPTKINTIVDFQWGTNNSPEGKNDGLTHCFVLSFESEADRDAYIPHPAHSGEFADVLRPHMKDVFVIDYWARPEGAAPDKPLQHAVFLKFKDDADPAEIQKVEKAFAALPSKIDQIKAFEWGTNNSPETNDDGFTHCFMLSFDSEEGRKAYLPHPDHEAFGEILSPVLDKVRVLDFWDQQSDPSH